MNRPRIYSDFNGPGQPHHMLLDYVGTLADLNRQNIVLHEGLLVTVYSDSDMEHDLEMDGVVCYGSPPGSPPCWHVKTDSQSLRHVKVQRGNQDSITLPCFNCGTDIYAQLKKDGLCPHCGCDFEHARPIPATQSNTEIFLPDRFEFQIWGPFRVSHFLKYLGAGRIEYKVRKFDHTLRPDHPRFIQEEITTFTPDQNQWQLFWQEVNRIGVWRWKRHYMDLRIFDGTMWDICMEFQKQFIESEGANAYPGGNGTPFSSNGEFEALVQAINKLTGLKIG